MLIYLCQGGESTITVRAPAGAVITASGGGEPQSATVGAGSTSVTLYPHTIANWTVTCAYSGRTISQNVNITTFGQSETIQFTALTVTSPSGYTIAVGSESRTSSGVLLIPGTGNKTVTCSKSGTPNVSETFSVAAGTVSYSRQFSEIACTAPSNPDSTISVGGFSRTNSGNIIVIGTGSKTLTCSRSSVNRTETVSITSGTVTGYSVSFSYAKIVAHTHPSASVSATKTVGSTTYNLSEVTADSNGVATLWVEKSAAINSTAWTVSANNGSVTDTRSATTNSLTAAPDVYPLDKVPIVVISSGGSSWTFKGATIDNSVVKFQSVTSNNQYTGWKGWFKTSCSFKFTYLNVYVDICIVGKGAGGGWYRYDTTLSTDYGGDGGAGGKVVNLYAPAFYVGTTYNVTIDGNGTSIGGITNASAGVGGGAAGGSGGEMYVSYGGPGGGAAGQYAFGSSSFDGVEYGHGGYGGDVNGGGAGTGARGRTDGVWSYPGAGGAGGGQSDNRPTSGINGIAIIKNHS